MREAYALMAQEFEEERAENDKVHGDNEELLSRLNEVTANQDRLSGELSAIEGLAGALAHIGSDGDQGGDGAAQGVKPKKEKKRRNARRASGSAKGESGGVVEGEEGGVVGEQDEEGDDEFYDDDEEEGDDGEEDGDERAAAGVGGAAGVEAAVAGALAARRRSTLKWRTELEGTKLGCEKKLAQSASTAAALHRSLEAANASCAALTQHSAELESRTVAVGGDHAEASRQLGEARQQVKELQGTVAELKEAAAKAEAEREAESQAAASAAALAAETEASLRGSIGVLEAEALRSGEEWSLAKAQLEGDRQALRDALSVSEKTRNEQLKHLGAADKARIELEKAHAREAVDAQSGREEVERIRGLLGESERKGSSLVADLAGVRQLLAVQQARSEDSAHALAGLEGDVASAKDALTLARDTLSSNEAALAEHRQTVASQATALEVALNEKLAADAEHEAEVQLLQQELQEARESFGQDASSTGQAHAAHVEKLQQEASGAAAEALAVLKRVTSRRTLKTVDTALQAMLRRGFLRWITFKDQHARVSEVS